MSTPDQWKYVFSETMKQYYQVSLKDIHLSMIGGIRPLLVEKQKEVESST